MSHIPASAMPHAKPHDEHDGQPQAETGDAATPATPPTLEPATSSDKADASDKVAAAASKAASSPVLVIAAIGVLAIGGIVAATLAFRGSEPPHKEPKSKAKGGQCKAPKPD